MDNKNLKGKFSEFGGQYVPETVMSSLTELEEGFNKYIKDEEFLKEYNYYLKDYVGRPTSLYFAENISKDLGFKVYLKREDLNHTGAHKINNAIGQILLAKRMGKKKVIAETGAGQHGLATATVCAKFGMECIIFMGELDIKRQDLNVKKMELLGAKIVTVTSGSKSLSDAVSEAIKYWVSNVSDSYYLIGSAVGPHPYPTIVREFQKIIGKEIKEEILLKEGRLPNYIIAPVGGGSNAIGAFFEFLKDDKVELIGVEGGGFGVDTKFTAATITKNKKGIIHGMFTYVLRDDFGNIEEAYSISAGLDYPGVGPEHAFLNSIGRVKYYPINDDEAMKSIVYLSKREGIIPAIESAHAVAYAVSLKGKLKPSDIVVINLSGRGDKDMDSINNYFLGGKIE
ncbi:tryptophan synthase subunit beta [Clostridium chrysemydis]|uniref:tryptophan synthase subunit beta n=1 Tax=Clostridium chrysemydis TaxID=2665504 RepID=UPI001883A324|nr:tryptophan synthase subunit beta [Clostridium chrysemydis]